MSALNNPVSGDDPANHRPEDRILQPRLDSRVPGCLEELRGNHCYPAQAAVAHLGGFRERPQHRAELSANGVHLYETDGRDILPSSSLLQFPPEHVGHGGPTTLIARHGKTPHEVRKPLRNFHRLLVGQDGIGVLAVGKAGLAKPAVQDEVVGIQPDTGLKLFDGAGKVSRNPESKPDRKGNETRDRIQRLRLQRLCHAFIEPGGGIFFAAKKPRPDEAQQSELIKRLDAISSQLTELRTRIEKPAE
jgi:hypothetical protein